MRGPIDTLGVLLKASSKIVTQVESPLTRMGIWQNKHQRPCPGEKSQGAWQALQKFGQENKLPVNPTGYNCNNYSSTKCGFVKWSILPVLNSFHFVPIVSDVQRVLCVPIKTECNATFYKCFIRPSNIIKYILRLVLGICCHFEKCMAEIWFIMLCEI